MSANSGAITETLADSMIKLAKRLHMKVIAEGVEEEKHLKFLKERDVEYAQGFLFSRPIPIEAFLKYLKTL
jgi:sensor c-di-GMP phosphodiesterase-like protein